MPGELKLPTLVLVDDDPAMRDFLRLFLSEAEYEILGEASSGPEAFRVLSSLKPDMVLLDMHLPGYSGIQVISMLRQASIHIPATIIITADRNYELADTLTREPSVMGFLIKPFSSTQLITAVKVSWVRYMEIRDKESTIVQLQKSLQDAKNLSKAKGLLCKKHSWSEPEAHRKIQIFSTSRRISLAQAVEIILASGDIPSDEE